MIALALGALLAVGCVLVAARPFLRTDAQGDALAPPLSAADEERLRLLEERDRALAALKELEFDHRTGKVSDADYATHVRALRLEAAEAIRALDAAPRVAAAPRSSEADVRA